MRLPQTVIHDALSWQGGDIFLFGCPLKLLRYGSIKKKDEAHLARLQTYRDDASVLVAAAAAFRLPREEGDEVDDDWDDE